MYYGDLRGGIDIVLEYSHVSPPDRVLSQCMLSQPELLHAQSRLSYPFESCAPFAVKLPLADLIVAMIDLVPQTRMPTGPIERADKN